MSFYKEDRNREIYDLRISGLKLREIGEKYGIGVERVRQIVAKEARKLRGCGHVETYERTEADPEGKNYIIKNGVEDLFLTKIERVNGITVYTYGSKEWKDGLRFTLETARELARKRKAVVIWLGVGA